MESISSSFLALLTKLLARAVARLFETSIFWVLPILWKINRSITFTVYEFPQFTKSSGISILLKCRWAIVFLQRNLISQTWSFHIYSHPSGNSIWILHLIRFWSMWTYSGCTQILQNIYFSWSRNVSLELKVAETPKDPVNLVATSSRFGLIFIAGGSGASFAP